MEVTQLVGLANRIYEKVETYSLGMRQRLGLAQALLHSPSLLILDEPTNGLDSAGIRELRNYIRKLSMENNTEKQQMFTFEDIMIRTFSFGFQITLILTLIISPQLVTSEFSWGTIKLLLIHSPSRAKILLSKYLTALAFSLYGLLVSSIIAIIIATLAAGINDSNLTPLLFPFLLQIGLKLFSFLIYICVAFLAALLSRNHFLSILVSIIFMMVTNPLIPVIPVFNLTISLLVWLVFYIVLLWICWLHFQHQDI
jgi:ABC-type transport system involved in multi-copper enzyme maturation permease subunit